VVKRPWPGLTRGAAAITRRRRLWPLLGALVVLVGAAIAVSSSGSSGPKFSFGPVSVASTPAATPAPAARPHTAAPLFKPPAAAVSLANSLPLPEQVAQLFLVSVDGSTAGAASALGSLNWGGVVLSSSNFVTDGQIGALAADIAASAQGSGKVPPLIAAAQDGGPQTAFPDLPPKSEPVIGASGQPAVASAQAQLAGKRLLALGVNMTLAPLADVDTPGGALSGRLFSTDPAAVARFSRAAVEGYHAAGVISAVGHFPGSGAASADPDQMTANVGGSIAELESRDLIPFAAVAAQAPVVVMSNASYLAFDGVTPAGLLPSAVRLLRHSYGFGGVVMSDDLDATLNATGSDPGTVAVEALRAGDNLLYISGQPSEHLAAYRAVLAAAQRSAAVRMLVRQALLRDLTLKLDYGVVPHH
jgi:beta-N-acetylhexosaminidase